MLIRGEYSLERRAPVAHDTSARENPFGRFIAWKLFLAGLDGVSASRDMDLLRATVRAHEPPLAKRLPSTGRLRRSGKLGTRLCRCGAQSGKFVDRLDFLFIARNPYASRRSNLLHNLVFFSLGSDAMDASKYSLEELLVLFERENKKVIDLVRRLSGIQAEIARIRDELGRPDESVSRY